MCHGQRSHKTKLIRDWFAKRSAGTPLHTHILVMAQSGRALLRLLTERQIKRGAHRSTAALEAAIEHYIEAHNRDPKPFRWTKSADNIPPPSNATANALSASMLKLDRNAESGH